MNRLLKLSVLCATALAASTAMAGVTFFEGENFTGRQVRADAALPNFPSVGFNDRAKSAIVDSGAWEICVDINFLGGCTTLAAGRYPNLGGWANLISSTRPAYEDRRADAREDRREERREEWRGERPRDGVRGRATATLYSGPNMNGRAFPLGNEGDANMYGQFNDQASSLRVDSGYWIFCSEPGFRGECRTFGPGDYARLPPELNNRISSGRRIANEYPYTQGAYRR